MDTALGKAARVFRERGYHATSIGDLMEAMELASGSVYKAFKDKRAVFLAAFGREESVRGEKLRHLVNADKPARDRILDALIFYAEVSSGVEGRSGCLVVGSVAELATFDAEITLRVTSALVRVERLMVDLIQQGQTDGSIKAGIDGETMARLLLCVLQGMRVAGKTGRTRTEMTAVAKTAMKLFD
jgi:TetR/AcrR family transcriptional repressor of nem operon